MRAQSVSFQGEQYRVSEELKGMARAKAIVKLSLSGTLTGHKLNKSGKSINGVQIGTVFGNWETVSLPYSKRDGGKTQTYVDVKCKCGIILARMLSSLRSGKSTQCISCRRKQQ